MPKKINNETIIQQFTDIHKDIYDYSLVEYKNAKSKVKILCPIHGVFEQSPQHHKNGVGCPKCKGGSKLSSTYIIQQFTDIHKDIYDYSLVEYKNDSSKVKIKCPIHGIFEQSPSNHKQGHGCMECNTTHGRNFYKDKKTILYYLKVNNVYKIGITKHSVKSRYSSDLRNVNIEIINQWLFEDGAKAYDYEQSIIKKCKAYKYCGEKILKSGNTELFNKDIISYISTII